MRRFLVAGNWKMNGSHVMTDQLIADITDAVLKTASEATLAYDVLVCPPAPYLSQAAALVESEESPVMVGAQNVSDQNSGAYTGEQSLSMLADIGCKYVLLGHSERRELFGETNKIVAQKFAACIGSEDNIIPVLCIGETLAQREAGETQSTVASQIDAVLELVGIQGLSNAVIAYEPVWAIGTGVTASPEQAQDVHAFIRTKLSELDAQIADRIQILYGGSVKPTNAEELFAQQDIDGGLIGGASLQAESFAGICEAARKLA